MLRLLSLATISALFTVLSACSLDEERLTLVKPRLGVDLVIAEELARLLDDPGRLRIELVENPHPDEPGIEALKKGLVDLALVPNTERYDPNVTTIAPLYATVLHIAYRAGALQGDTIGNLKEVSVFAGPPGSPSRMILETAAGRDGVRPEEINYIDSADDCADIIVVYAAVLPEVLEQIRLCGDYRLFSLGRPEEIGMGSAVDSVSLLNPALKPFVIPADTYAELTPEPVVSLAVDKLLVARSDLSETTVYDLLGEIVRMKPALSASYPALFQKLTDKFDTSSLSFVLHPGALAYLQRDEPDLYERYSGVAEVVVTLMIGLVSGVYAIWQILGIRRKNRIDAFCREAIGLRDGHAAGETEAEATIGALKALQDQAYDLMVRERLSADESFQIFITLTNDIIADISGAGRLRQT